MRINKSKNIAKFVFYLGVAIASLFGSGSLTYMIITPEYTAYELAAVFFGIIPTMAGLIIAYMGSYMARKNKRIRGRRRH